MIVRNEIDMLSTFLHHYIDLGFPVVIVDMESTDGTLDYLTKFRNSVSVYSYSRSDLFTKGYSHARNFAAEKCKTNWVFSLDADEYIDASDLLVLNKLVCTSSNSVLGFARKNYSKSDLNICEFKKIIELGEFDLEDQRRAYNNSLESVRREGFIHEELYIEDRSAYFNNDPTNLTIHHFSNHRPNEDPQYKNCMYSWMIMHAKVNRELQYGTNAYWYNKHINQNFAALIEKGNKFAVEHNLPQYSASDLGITLQGAETLHLAS